MSERFTSRSGVRIRYLDNAPSHPVGLPILLSPGFTDFADEYEEVLSFFAPRRAIVVEVRGRGGSEAPASGYTAQEHANDLQAVLDEEGIERFHAMTFSRGTTWGLDLVLADPGRVASVSIGDYWPREHALGAGMAEQVMAGRFRGTPMRERVASHVIPSLFAASVDRDLHDALAATGLPVLVATGTEPGCILDEGAIAEYQRRVPGVEFVRIEGATHDLFRPDRCAYPRAVVDFIERRVPGG
jgi:pimeloyl-ACP methyl ester carboxylesterase